MKRTSKYWGLDELHALTREKLIKSGKTYRYNLSYNIMVGISAIPEGYAINVQHFEWYRTDVRNNISNAQEFLRTWQGYEKPYYAVANFIRFYTKINELTHPNIDKAYAKMWTVIKKEMQEEKKEWERKNGKLIPFFQK